MRTRLSTGRTDAARAGSCLAPLSIPSVLRFVWIFLLTCFAPAAVAGTNVVQYTYDAAGNIVQIARQTAPGLAITSFAPTSGAVGTAVTIYGSGFDPTPANNTVKFNGTVATVTASASGSISTTVPSGATTGPISVTVGASTATSTQSFTVTVLGAPTITSFSPTSGAAATSVAVTGTAFDTAAGATTVKLNGVAATATVASDTSLSFAVPASAASGKITATTAIGTGTSANDFIVPPAGVNAADIVSTGRLAPGSGTVNIAVPTLNKYGLVLFDGQPNVYYSVQFSAVAVSPTTATVQYQIIKPDNSVLQTGAITGTGRPTIHLPALTTAGTYGVLLSPGGATLNTNVRVDIDPVASVDGPPVASSLDYAYQSARFVFTAAANQRVGVGGLGLGFTPANTGTPGAAITVLKPDGTQVASGAWSYPSSSNPEGDWDVEFVAPVAGTYALVMDSPQAFFANATLQFTSDVTGSLSPDVVQPITLSRVGQDAFYTFTASVGDSFGVDLSGVSPLPRAQTIYVLITRPDGFVYKSCSATPPSALFCDLSTLSMAGTYSLRIDPNNGAYGSFNLTLKQGPMLQTTDPPTAFAASGATETQRFRFSATAGQNLSLGVSNLGGGSTYFTVYTPSGSTTGSASTCDIVGVSSGYCRAVLTNLPQTGTYSVALQPAPGKSISGNINLSNDVTGTLASGVPQSVNASRQGQMGRFTFAGTVGDSTSIKFAGVSTTPTGRTVSVYVNRPDGTYIGSSSTNASNGSALINFPSLPSTGNYSVTLDPSYGGAWQGTVELDPGTPIAVDGSLVSITSTNAGEAFRYTVPLTTGQRVEFGLSGLAYSPSGTGATYVTLYNPAGTSVMSPTCGTSFGCDAVLAAAATTGIYTLIVSPPGGNAISSGTFALSTQETGTFVIGDPAQTLAINRPGQTARYTFDGTAAQTLRLNWASVAVSGTAIVGVSILKPDGTTLTNSSIANGVSGGVDLPALPTTGTYAVVFDPQSAETMSASISLVTR